MGKRHQGLLEDDDGGSKDQHHPQRGADQAVDAATGKADVVHAQQGQQRRRNAAHRQNFGDAPVNILVLLVGHHAASLGNGGIQQVRPHRRGGRHVEIKQDRRHQGTTANPRHADNEANSQAGNDITNFKFHYYCPEKEGVSAAS